MVLLRYLLVLTGIGLLAGAASILAWDLYQILKSKKSPGETPPPEPRWHYARQLVTISLVPILTGLSIAVVPTGSAGVCVNQFTGVRGRPSIRASTGSFR